MKFGMLTVVRMGHGPSGRVWYCVCDCGKAKEKPLTTYELKAGVRSSCGCSFKPKDQRSRTHGQSGTRLYKVWSSMKHRCSNPNDKHYANYGGRGIHVCPEWQSFDAFMQWAAVTGYQAGLTIDRIDSNSHYEPGNCRWIPKPEQSNNTRRSRFISYRGDTKTLKDWAAALGIPYCVLQARITRYRWSVDRAFETPVYVAPA